MRRTNRKSTETPPGAAPEVEAAELARHTLIRLLARQAVADFLANAERTPDVAPSHTVEPDSQMPVSPFNDFFDSILRHFLRDLEISDHAVMEAMQHASARIDWTEEETTTE